MMSLRAFFDEEAHDFPAHGRPAAVGSPASPAHKAAIRLAHMAVGVLVGVMAGLGGELVSVDLGQVLGARPKRHACQPAMSRLLARRTFC